MENVRLEYKLLTPDAQVPTRNLETDAAFDLYAAEGAMVSPHDFKYVKIGLKCAAPPGFYYTIMGRSGLLKKGIMALHGLIDATYTGEVIVGLYNMSGTLFKVKVGDRIAQMVVHQMVVPRLEEVKQFSKEYDQRGTAGWGSSGA